MEAAVRHGVVLGWAGTACTIRVQPQTASSTQTTAIRLVPFETGSCRAGLVRCELYVPDPRQPHSHTPLQHGFHCLCPGRIGLVSFGLTRSCLSCPNQDGACRTNTSRHGLHYLCPDRVVMTLWRPGPLTTCHTDYTDPQRAGCYRLYLPVSCCLVRPSPAICMPLQASCCGSVPAWVQSRQH
jgi:hypothetical protein